MNNKLIRNIAILAVVYIGGVYVYKMLTKKKNDSAKPSATPSAAQPEASFSNVAGQPYKGTVYVRGAYNKALDSFYYYPEGNPQGKGFYRGVTAATRPTNY
jgi:hypothetical protein